VQVVAILERDVAVVGDDLVVAVGLQEENVLQRDAREMLEAGAGLDGFVQVELPLVDEDVNRFVVWHDTTPCLRFRGAGHSAPPSLSG